MLLKWKNAGIADMLVGCLASSWIFASGKDLLVVFIILFALMNQSGNIFCHFCNMIIFRDAITWNYRKYITWGRQEKRIMRFRNFWVGGDKNEDKIIKKKNKKQFHSGVIYSPTIGFIIMEVMAKETYQKSHIKETYWKKML